MAKNKDQKRKERATRVAKKKLEETTRRRNEAKAAAEKAAGGVMSKKIANEAETKTKFEDSTKLPRKLGG